MSELKEWTASEIEEYDDARLELAEDGKIDCTRVYIKADADEVISTIRAERDEYRYNLSCARNEIHNMQPLMRDDIKTIANLKADYKEACDRLQTANLIKDEQLAATRHQKYKRCLAMAKWCEAELFAYPPFGTESPKEKWWQKWHKSWLEFAEKFKDE